MLIATDNYFAFARDSAFKELIVVRVFTYGYFESLGINELPMNCNQFDNWQYIDLLEFR